MERQLFEHPQGDPFEGAWTEEQARRTRETGGVTDVLYGLEADDEIHGDLTMANRSLMLGGAGRGAGA